MELTLYFLYYLIHFFWLYNIIKLLFSYIFKPYKIIFKGFLSKDEYYNVLNECDIFCMTRINSQFANAGFPFKLGEFLATGKAVISTNVSDVNKFIRNGENALIIRPSSEDEIAEALIYILKNPILINKLGTEGRKTAELNFDSEKISLDLFQIFGCI